MNTIERQYNKITLKGARWLLLFVFYLQFLIPVLLEAKWSKYMQEPVPDYLVMLVIQLFAVFVPSIVFIYLNGANYGETLKLSRLTLPQGIMCAILGITAQSLASVLNVPVLFYIQQKSGMLPGAAVTAPVNITQLLWGFLFVALLPAIFEELLMRGIVLSATQENGYRASLIIGGLYFALIHNQAESIVGHFFLGFLLCYIVWMTQSIWGGVIAHFSFNAFGMTLDYIIKTKSEHWLGADFFHHTVTVVSIILFFLFWGTINRKRIRRYKSRHLVRQLIFSVFNFPMILVVLGYIMFQLIRY